jgi:hypothetical protein
VVDEGEELLSNSGMQRTGISVPFILAAARRPLMPGVSRCVVDSL